MENLVMYSQYTDILNNAKKANTYYAEFVSPNNDCIKLQLSFRQTVNNFNLQVNMCVNRTRKRTDITLRSLCNNINKYPTEDLLRDYLDSNINMFVASTIAEHVNLDYEEISMYLKSVHNSSPIYSMFIDIFINEIYPIISK